MGRVQYKCEVSRNSCCWLINKYRSQALGETSCSQQPKIYAAVRNVPAGYCFSYLRLTAFLHVSTWETHTACHTRGYRVHHANMNTACCRVQWWLHRLLQSSVVAAPTAVEFSGGCIDCCRVQRWLYRLLQNSVVAEPTAAEFSGGWTDCCRVQWWLYRLLQSSVVAVSIATEFSGCCTDCCRVQWWLCLLLQSSVVAAPAAAEFSGGCVYCCRVQWWLNRLLQSSVVAQPTAAGSNRVRVTHWTLRRRGRALKNFNIWEELPAAKHDITLYIDMTLQAFALPGSYAAWIGSMPVYSLVPLLQTYCVHSVIITRSTTQFTEHRNRVWTVWQRRT
jgi:hypothetical protein